MIEKFFNYFYEIMVNLNQQEFFPNLENLISRKKEFLESTYSSNGNIGIDRINLEVDELIAYLVREFRYIEEYANELNLILKIPEDSAQKNETSYFFFHKSGGFLKQTTGKLESIQWLNSYNRSLKISVHEKSQLELLVEHSKSLGHQVTSLRL